MFPRNCDEASRKESPPFSYGRIPSTTTKFTASTLVLTHVPAKPGPPARFSEDEFIARIRAGRAIPGSPMPWQGFQRLREDDLQAIYRYLKTRSPVVHDVGPAYVDR